MELIHGINLIADGDMVLQHRRMTGREFEAKCVAAWQGAGLGVYIDLGAYTGLYSIIAAKNGRRVVAFEPNPACFNRLLENIEANDVAGIDAHRIAASDRSGSGMLSVNSTKISSGGSLAKTTGKQIPAKLERLDDMVDLSTPVAAIKIDVEGHECEALAGAFTILTLWRPLLITEALTPAAQDQQAAILEPLGYHVAEKEAQNLIWTTEIC